MGKIDNKKYHISDEGIIYRVNEDGSFTQLGDIVGFINNANENNSVSPKKASSRKRIMPYVIIIICALTLGLYLFSPTGEKNSELKAENARLHQQIDTLIYLRQRDEVIAKENDKLNQQLQNKNPELKAENDRLYQQIDILIEENNNLRQRDEVIAKENDKLNQQLQNKNLELKAENARLYHQIDILIEENNYLRKRTEAIAKEIDKLNNRKKSLF